jgi:hypothetical protein
MECYHGVISLDHRIEGKLSLGSRCIDFTGGRGYTEKDWGRAFPEAYIWCQSNHFSMDRISLTGSIAIIPWINRPFLGFIFGLWINDRLYRFTTYTGARLIRFSIDAKRLTWVLKQRHYLLQISAARLAGGFLQGPASDGMTRRISEVLNSTLDVRLSRVTSDRETVIFHGTGNHAGLEIIGDTQRLIEMFTNSQTGNTE